MKKYILAFFFVISLLIFTGCSKNNSKNNVSTITIMTHDSFNISSEVIAIFEKKNNSKVKFLKSGDAGEALNKAILSRNNPMADIFYGVDNTFLSRAINEDIFLPYNSPMLRIIDDQLKLDSGNRLVPVDYGDVCINYDKKWFKNKNLKPPEKLEDLVNPEFKGLLVVQNPATSSPGLAFLLTSIAKFGEDGYLEFWEKLKKNNVFITNGWKEAYWGKFSGASKGDKPIVISYASSPAAEVYFAKEKITEAPTGIVTEQGSAFRQIEFAGILKGTKNIKLAQKFIDFLLSKDFQQDIFLQMFVFPSNKNVKLPEVFKNHAFITEKPAFLSPEIISEKRDKWIEQWMELIL
ncbi:MAG: thiamine ABC transporter substrate-binding protein [Desulfobacteraceae bacterium 4572_130]|nr:MAG: thiamine ABC transporter substrate-binding protein [Desulfobacteraceae bacterium 4572_130]